MSLDSLIAQSTAPLQRGKTSSTSVLVYDTIQSDGGVAVILEPWEMQSTPSLPSLSCPLWLRVVASDRVLSMSQIELNCLLMLN